MASRKKERKMCCKRNTYISKSAYSRNKKWNSRNNTMSRQQIKDLNEIIYNYKSRKSWKVVPKDSLEVHKDRRKRQLDDKRKKEENKYDEDDKRQTTRRRKRLNSRSDSETSSSYSTLSCCTSCACHMDCE